MAHGLSKTTSPPLSAGSTLTSTGSWIQGASGNISNSNSNNAFKTLTIAGTGVTTTLTGNVRVGFAITGGGTITMGPGTINGGGLYSFFVAVHNNDDINVSNVAIGTSLYQFRIIPQVDVTQKVLTLPNNFGEVIFQNTYGHNITATGNFNFGNNTCGVIDKNDGTTPVNYVDMSASSLTCGALLMGYASALNDNGWLKLGSSTGHSFASINNGPGNAGTRNILDLGSGTTTISGSVNFTGINVTPGTSTVTLTGTGASNTLTSAGQSFYNLTQNGGSATDTYTLQDTLTVAHTLTLTKGVLDTKSGSNFGVTIGSANPVNGDFSQTTTAKFTARSSLITLNGNGNFTADGTLANSQYNSASLTLNGTNTLSYNNTDNTNGFNNLIVGQNGNTTTLTTGQQIPVGNLLTVGSGTLTQAGTELSGGVFLYGSNPLSFNVASVVSVPSLWFRSASQTIPSLTNGYDCSLTLSTDGTTVTQTGNVVLNTTKNLNLNNISGRAGTWKTDGYNLTTVGGDILIGNSGGNSALKKLDATHNGARTSTITVGGNWLNYGTGSAPSQFIADNSTVIFNSTATGKTITEGSTIIPNAFNNLTFNGTGGGWTLQDNLTASALRLVPRSPPPVRGYRGRVGI
ncbi:MAG: hypothetical protein NT155_02155 [Candidatus Staskawiczbacteria bacterium]|nr:hypothetical protein [Candidatus Staskawiczbacteria bacterium]